jgi:hypothetical protein
MRSKKKQFKMRIILILIGIISILQVFAQETGNVQYSFKHTDTTYSFYGRFKLIACSECLLSICFNYEHVKALAPDAKEVTLIKQDGNQNQIKYIYFKYPFFKNESLWHRVLDRKNSRVDFRLLSSKNSHSIMPQMLSSTGYYKITPSDKYLWVEYFQECRLMNNQITGLYLYLVKKKAVEFLQLFSKYAEAHCHKV